MMHPSLDDKNRQRAQIEKHVAAFKNAGGTVTQLPTGESGTTLPFAPAKSRVNQRKMRRSAESVEDEVL